MRPKDYARASRSRPCPNVSYSTTTKQTPCLTANKPQARVPVPLGSLDRPLMAMNWSCRDRDVGHGDAGKDICWNRERAGVAVHAPRLQAEAESLRHSGCQCVCPWSADVSDGRHGSATVLALAGSVYAVQVEEHCELRPLPRATADLSCSRREDLQITRRTSPLEELERTRSCFQQLSKTSRVREKEASGYYCVV